METIYWISIAIILYTYAGYGVLLWICVMIRRLLFPPGKKETEAFTPTLTVIVTAYNEVSCIEKKIENTLSLTYPATSLHIIFITDGSDDGTPELVSGFPQVQLMHNSLRSGKTAAIHRAMQEVNTEIVVFTDANAMLNPDALLRISRHYSNERTGAVSGEKRVDISGVADAVSGEGLYWRYESFIKQYESEMYSVAGAAGELFSTRTALYEPVRNDTILDDFMFSMNIAIKGYRIRYEPMAYAVETTSASLAEERKRKLRIAAGDIQAMLRLPFLSLLFSKPLLWFEYTSHRILRWVITPYLLVTALLLNVLLVSRGERTGLISWALYAQLLFYGVSFTGWLLRRQKLKWRLFFVPYYFCMMNYGIVAGSLRYILKRTTR